MSSVVDTQGYRRPSRLASPSPLWLHGRVLASPPALGPIPGTCCLGGPSLNSLVGGPASRPKLSSLLASTQKLLGCVAMEMMELSLQSHPLDFLEQPALFLIAGKLQGGF